MTDTIARCLSRDLEDRQSYAKSRPRHAQDTDTAQSLHTVRNRRAME